MKYRTHGAAIVVIAIAIVAGLQISRIAESPRNTNMSADPAESIRVIADDFAIRVVPQTARQRSFRDVAYRERFRVGEGHGLLDPRQLHVYSPHDIYVRDYADFLIKRYAGDGTLVAKYGEGRGQGPGEAGNAVDFDVLPDAGVIVADAGNFRLNRFDSAGRYIRTYMLSPAPGFRVGVLPSGFIAVTSGDVDHGPVTLLDTTGQIHAASKPILRGEFAANRTQHSLQGLIRIDRSGNTIVYSTIYAGLIFRYDDTADLIYARRTIDPPDIPELRVQTFPGGSVSYGLHFDRIRESSFSFCIDADRIFLLWARQSEPREVIDVYDLETGDYDHSFLPPPGTRQIAVLGNILYTINDVAQVVSYDFHYEDS